MRVDDFSDSIRLVTAPGDRTIPRPSTRPLGALRPRSDDSSPRDRTRHGPGYPTPAPRRRPRDCRRAGSLDGFLPLDTAASAELDVVTSSFEEADVARAAFDLAVAATSFHWVDQEVGLSKLGQALRPGGWAALWWTLFRDPNQLDEFSQAVEHILGPVTRGAFDEPGRPPFQLDESHRRRDPARGAGLDDVTSKVITWPGGMTPVQARALYGSMASVIRRPPDEKRILDDVERLATELSEGVARRRFVTALYTGRRP